MVLQLFLSLLHSFFFFFFKQTCKETQDIGALTKAADFVKAFVLGFQVEVGN